MWTTPTFSFTCHKHCIVHRNQVYLWTRQRFHLHVTNMHTISALTKLYTFTNDLHNWLLSVAGQSLHTSSNGSPHPVKKVQKNFKNNYASVECGAKILSANNEAKVQLRRKMDWFPTDMIGQSFSLGQYIAFDNNYDIINCN